MDFDGILCEVYFNTFKDWRISMFFLLQLLPYMLIYPLKSFF